MVFDLRPARATAVTRPPPVPITELRRSPRTRVRWNRVLGLAAVILASLTLWAMILAAVWLLVR